MLSREKPDALRTLTRRKRESLRSLRLMVVLVPRRLLTRKLSQLQRRKMRPPRNQLLRRALQRRIRKKELNQLRSQRTKRKMPLRTEERRKEVIRKPMTRRRRSEAPLCLLLSS